MRRSRGISVVLACLYACSGDDGHRHGTMPMRPAAGSAAPIGNAGSAGSTTPAPGPAPPAVPAPLSEDMAKPHFTSGDAAAGVAAFAADDWATARAKLGAARETLTGTDRARVELLLGLANVELGAWTKAAEHLDAAHAGLPLLADFTAYHAARAHYFAKRGARALELARTVGRDSIVGPEAELLVGDVLRGMGDVAATAAHYRDYLTRRPEGLRRSEARYRLAEALERTNADEARKLYRQIGIDDPLSSWASRGQARIGTLGVPAAPLTAAEHITRGMQLFDAMRNPESEAAFEAALADPAITPADRCVAAYHRAQSRFKARDRKGAASMFDTAATDCEAAGNVDLRIKSLYQAGRSYAFIGQHPVAIANYQAAQVVDPSHSYSDDALLREAEEWTSLADAAKVEATLSALPTRFPKGDNLAEAMWRLGWQAWKAKDHAAAIKWWSKQIELVPHDDNYYGEGQAQYWLGRAYLATGSKDKALASWEAGVRQYPAAYYALQGLNRIREVAPKKYAALVAELASDPAGYDPAAPAFTFKPRVEWGSPGFARAMELLRLGLGGAASEELRKLGLVAPPGKKRVDDPELVEKLWAMAYLFDRAGRHSAALWPTRWHILDYRRQWPVGTNRARWKIAYPLGYEQLLRAHATKNNAPFAMQIGIVREESGFDPRTESYANAWGLTQMIAPTATDFSKGTGIAPTRENMFDPEKNVTVGSRFLGFLFEHFQRFTLLVPPGYNAGPAAVRRMLKARGTMDADEFIEAIVDDQARNYSKRVLGSFFTYSWLYEQTVPEIPLAIPAALIPKK